MRISRLIAIAVCAVLTPLAAGAGSGHAGTVAFSSAREALKQGMSAYQGGYYEIAIPALEHAASENEFMASYYLARIYSDNTSAYTDHAKAYVLLQKLVDEYAEIDPDNDPRAFYVGRSITALAGYVRTGLPQIGLVPNLGRSIEYLHHASVMFDDEDAQFELAKLELKGEGVEANEHKARHWLSVLTQKGHAGAQAFLADLLWRGKFMAADPARALALISVAKENAPAQERLWIEDIYQNIFCGSASGVRKQASGIVAGWGNRYGRKASDGEHGDLGQLPAGPVRSCKNGEPVGPVDQIEATVVPQQGTEQQAGESPSPPLGASRPAFSLGAASGGGTLRDVGAGFAPTQPEAPRGDR
ncbi:MAG: sel1 repeat family protein [Hyphomicrobium sp.]